MPEVIGECSVLHKRILRELVGITATCMAFDF